MTASLNHSGSSGSRSSSLMVCTSGSPMLALSEEILEVIFRPHEPPQREHVRRHHLGHELDEVVPAAPRVARTAQHVVHLERLVGCEAERDEVEIDPRPMRVVWI